MEPQQSSSENGNSSGSPAPASMNCSIEESEEQRIDQMDFYRLSMKTLQRYAQQHNLSIEKGSKKADIARVVAKHFRTIDIEGQEDLIITTFISKMRMRRLAEKKAKAKTGPKSKGTTGTNPKKMNQENQCGSGGDPCLYIN